MAIEHTAWPGQGGWSYELNLPVRYRLEGETRWRSGVTERLGADEAVITAETPASPDTDIMFIASMPATPYGRDGCIVGYGSVVECEGATRAPLFVVSVSRYRLERLDQVLRRHALRDFQVARPHFGSVVSEKVLS
jgi:hypothetical protein